MTTQTKHPAVAKFEKSLRAVEGVHYRVSKGLLTGRNGNQTEAALRLHYGQLRELVRDSDEVCDALDSNEKLSKRYRRAERYCLLGEWLT